METFGCFDLVMFGSTYLKMTVLSIKWNFNQIGILKNEEKA